MNCASCSQPNRDGATFCTRCGSPLNAPIVCPKCGAPAEVDDQFCASCGQSLTNTSGAIHVGPPTVQPTSFVDGRYEVKRFLGEGGKKRVFLAHDTKLDRDVAFALIKTDDLNAEGQARIRREAQAMGKLGDHQHIVPVYDIGEEGGHPYLVTQLMGGGDVEGLIEKAPDHRLPLDTVLQIADQMCQALEYAHAKGIVHRDLKPGNVWLTADGTAKLGDFGLAVALDRSRLTQAGMMVGTVSYMPPEQAIGGEVTPRSDLYSLGAMLYEMACGRPPFVGDESVAIIGQHLNTPPVAPTWHRPDCPPGLEALILRLLEKDPGKRPVSAHEAQQALAGVELTAPILSEAEAHGERAPDNPLYRRTFVGRENELRQLRAGFDAAASGLGALVMVVGEPGIGKTALIEQLATYATLRGGKSLVGHCYEEGSLSLPYLPFVEGLRSYVLTREPDRLRDELGSGAADVARIISEIRDRVQVELRPPGDQEDDRWRLFQAVTGFLRNAAAVQPILLVLEDLHWADRGTIDFLVHLSRNVAGARLLIVGTYRDVEVDRAHPLSSALAELRRSGDLSRVVVRGLTVDEVHRMINAMQGQVVRWSLAEAVHRQTEGSPLFIQEVLRYLVEERLIVHSDGRWRRTGETAPELSIPEGLRDVIGKRLARLSAECNRVLSVAAVIGRDFELATLQLLDAAPAEEELFTALEEAVHVGVLEDQSHGGGVHFRFAHTFFRQMLYEENFTPRRLRLHQDVARALEQQYAARLDDHAAELAEHFAQSTDPADLAKAVKYGEMAAKRAMGVFAYGEAVRHLERALLAQEVFDPDNAARRCDLLLALGEALGPAGEPQRVFEDVAEQALSMAEAHGDDERAVRICQLAIEALTRWGAARARLAPEFGRWVERLDRHAAPGTRARLEADIRLAGVQLRSGRWAEGRSSEARSLAAARAFGDAETLFLVATEMMRTTWPSRGWSELATLARELADRPRDGISQHTLWQFLIYAPEILLAAGDRLRAEALWHEQDELGVQSRDTTHTGLRNESYRNLLGGNLEGAIATAERRLAMGEETNSPAERVRAWVVGFWPLLWLGQQGALTSLVEERLGEEADVTDLGWKGLWLAHRGRMDEAEAQLHRSMERLEISDEASARPLAQFLETAVMVRDPKAIALLASALDGVPAVTTPLSAVTRHLGGAARLLGDPAAARDRYQQALAWATKISFRPEIALTRLDLAELLLDNYPEEQPEAQVHLDFAIAEFRAMKMQPALERALRHKGLLKA